MEYSRLPMLPIPASIRRRLSRIYPAHKAVTNDELSGALRHNALVSSSEPHLPFNSQHLKLAAIEPQRPSTASDDLDSFEFVSRESNSPSLEDTGCSANYETNSGLRWNRVVPAFNLLRNAGYEAQQSHADGRLVRSLYINALMYLLDALPSDITTEEARMLQHRLPETVKVSIEASSSSQIAYQEGSPSPRDISPPRSYLHRLLASLIVQFFLLLRFILPYFKLFLRQVYEYERSHRITERIVTTTLDAADGLGKSSVNFGSAVCQLNEGRVGTAVGNLAAWWVEGIAGGIYEGVGEGMVHLGLLKPGLELDRLALRIDRR
ncbi:hypothetical protein N7462_005997 [Penicillium macrosclerotiorum]|uniref:uncharacterized protein n=1 Tax=Penicillium macrosclerotiorum TaxID=303699 RepID=UPI002546AF95|nr:uncharacterized protein N7462_005997 [Penicillium macrosclerotiorum]KAJ5682832.1 hypothetical protein N7462_005997 [Penicillium macrosclerotiorum]